MPNELELMREERLEWLLKKKETGSSKVKKFLSRWGKLSSQAVIPLGYIKACVIAIETMEEPNA